MSKKNLLKLEGMTTEKLPVVSGVFYFTGTKGLPLEDVLFRLKSNKMVVDWIDWCTDALKEGWNPDTIISKTISAVSETYGSKYGQNFEKRIRSLMHV